MNFHWFIHHECQHIFRLQMWYICTSSVSLIGLQKSITAWPTKLEIFMLHLFCDYNTLTTVISVTNTRSIQKTPMFHDCTKTHLNITINKWKCAKLWALNTFEVTGPYQVFVYMLLTFKLLKLFRKPVVLLCDILMLYLWSL